MNPTIFSSRGRAFAAFRGGVLVAGCVTFAPNVAHAYTISTVLTAGCHESISSAALRAIRLELATAAPLLADRNERALITDLEFTPDGDMTDLGGATLLVGVRDNDLARDRRRQQPRAESFEGMKRRCPLGLAAKARMTTIGA